MANWLKRHINYATQNEIQIVDFDFPFGSKTEVLFPEDSGPFFAKAKMDTIIRIPLDPIAIKYNFSFNKESIPITVRVSFDVTLNVPMRNLHSRRIKHNNEEISVELISIFKNGNENATFSIAEKYSGIQSIVQLYSPLELYLLDFTIDDGRIKEILNYGIDSEYSEVKNAVRNISTSTVKRQIEDKLRENLKQHSLILANNFLIDIEISQSKLQELDPNNTFNRYTALQRNIAIKNKTFDLEKLRIEEIRELEQKRLSENDKSNDEFLRKDDERAQKERMNILRPQIDKAAEVQARFDLEKELLKNELNLQAEEKIIEIENKLIGIREKFYDINKGKEYLDVESFKTWKGKFALLKEKELAKSIIVIEKEIKTIDESLKILPEELNQKLRLEYQSTLVSLEITSKLAQQELLLKFSLFDEKQRENLLKVLGEEISKIVGNVSKSNQNITLYNLSTGNLLNELAKYFTNKDSSKSILALFDLVKRNIDVKPNVEKSNESPRNPGTHSETEIKL